VTATLTALVSQIRYEAKDIHSIELRPVGATAFPAFEAGSHIDLHLGNGQVRSYSLFNPAGETHRYCVGVLKDAKSRGGSRWVHEQLRVGSTLTISAPRNNFPLQEGADHSVLVAGGIGITPILCMGRRLQAQGRPFEVLYFARSQPHAAFVAEVEALGVPVHWHFDDARGGPPDLRSLLAARPAGGPTAPERGPSSTPRRSPPRGTAAATRRGCGRTRSSRAAPSPSSRSATWACRGTMAR